MSDSPSSSSRAALGGTAVLLGVTIVAIEFISGFTQGFYEPLIPRFGSVLGVDASNLTLFNTIPTAVAALVVPILTKLGDIHGYRRLLRVVIPIVAVATVVIAVGTAVGSWPLVLVGRFLNAPIAVWLPLHIALVHSRASGQRAARYVSLIVASLTIGTVVGMASSGVIYSWLSDLPTTLAIVPVLQVIAVVLVCAVMPEFVAGADAHIDVVGFILLGLVMVIAIVGFVTVVEGGAQTVVGIVSLVVAVALAGAFYRWELRTPHPAVDVRVLFSSRLAPIYVGAVSFGAVSYGFLSPLATFLDARPDAVGYGFGFSSTQVSITQTAFTLATALAAFGLPFLAQKWGFRPSLIIGFTVAAVGFALWAVLDSSQVELVAFIAAAGLGLGTIQAIIPVIIPERAPEGTHGIAVGLYNSAQTLGGALGGGLFLSLLTVGHGPAGEITRTGYTTVWATCAGILFVGLVVIVVFLTKDPSTDRAESAVLPVPSTPSIP